MLLIIDRYRYYFFVTIIIACRLIQCVCKCVRVYIYICTWIYAACCHTSYMFWHNTSKNRAGLQPWLMMALMDTGKSITSYPGGSQGIPGGSQGDPRGHHWKRICCRRNCGSNQSRNLWGFEPNLPHSEPVFLGHFTNNHGVKYQPMPG